MTHAQAFAQAIELGGVAHEHVSRQTTILVLGEEFLEDDGYLPRKLRRARQLQQAGAPLRLISESDWLVILGRQQDQEGIQRLYTPAMLGSLLRLPAATIRRWERLGLIRPVQRVFRLPLFDFREVTIVRRLSELLTAGIPRDRLEQTLKLLPSVQRGDQRPLEQLELLCVGHNVAVRDQFGLVAADSQQRLLDFATEASSEEQTDPPDASLKFVRPVSQTADWYSQGVAAQEQDQLDTAIHCFRQSLMTAPARVETHVRLAECLYRRGQTAAALERYHAAVEHDHRDLEAWTQIGCLYRELSDLAAAEAAFRVALEIEPTFPDALWHCADLLHAQGRTLQAVPLWRQYLLYDSYGPWADSIRQSLEDVTQG